MKEKIKSAVLNATLLGVTIAIAIPVGSYAARAYQTYKSHAREGSFGEHVSNMPYRITLYGTSTCSHCVAAREYLRRAGIGFNDLIVDQSSSATEKFMKLDKNSVPVLVSEKNIIVGFSASEFDELIKKSGNR